MLTISRKLMEIVNCQIRGMVSQDSLHMEKPPVQEAIEYVSSQTHHTDFIASPSACCVCCNGLPSCSVSGCCLRDIGTWKMTSGNFCVSPQLLDPICRTWILRSILVLLFLRVLLFSTIQPTSENFLLANQWIYGPEQIICDSANSINGKFGP